MNEYPITAERDVWIELTGVPSLDGKVLRVRSTPFEFQAAPHPATVPMVATGSVRWVGDRPVEVWVPEGRLDLWRAEFEVGDG